MRRLTYILFLVFILQLSYGQETEGDYYVTKDISNNDSINKVSLLGNYFSFGFGNGGTAYRGGMGLFLNYSFAIKSHMITISACGVSSGRDRTSQSIYTSGYVGLLFGESLRRKKYMLSLSVGVAKSMVEYSYPGTKVFSRNGQSFPVETKLYIYLNHLIGIGFIHSVDIDSKFIANYNAISIVYGLRKKYK